MRCLLILLWKHCIVRKRMFFQTFLEFTIPLCFFLLIFMLKNKIKPKSYADESRRSDGKLGLPTYSEIIALSDVRPQPYWIMYYPETPITVKLMDEVGVKLGMKRLDSIPTHSRRGYFPYSTDSRELDLSANKGKMKAIIIFQDMFEETLPDHLNYTIRLEGNFGVESLSSLDAKLGPHNLNGLEYGTFMRIQWAVDTSYIKLRTGKEVPQVVSLQEFLNTDKLSNNRNEAITFICELSSMLTYISLMQTFSFIFTQLLQERISGIQELVQLVGVPLHIIRMSHVLNMFPVGLVFAICVTCFLKCTSNPLIDYSSWILIFLLLILYFNFVVSVAIAGSYALNDTQYARSLSILMYLALWVPGRLIKSQELSHMQLVALGLLPNVPLIWFWTEVTELEHLHEGANFRNMGKSHTTRTGSILMSYIFLLLQMAFWYTMTWYLSLVRPGQFGQALPWNFCCKWSKKEDPPHHSADTEIAKNPRYFESAPPKSVPGIKIINVSKVYPKNKALKNVSLDVYKGDITVLLGHNGAGKTTLMKIITGMTSATHGKVYVNGKDIVTRTQEVRRHMGLCPQQNIFFDKLTVREHFMFFTLLRWDTLNKQSIADAEASSKQLARKLGLSEKLNSLTSQLSGGMQRRVQLGCALAGDSDVLVLDEPTSGLDVETRRELWNLLLSLRGDRTVFLTTHYMEEADALGDRVAAIHSGELKCSATTMHLKKAVGTGYRLSLVTAGNPQEEAITKLVTSHVPDATIKERAVNSLTYNVPTTNIGNFSSLFAALEAKRSELQIDSMALGVATLEEVFMKLCSDIDTTLTEDEVDTTRLAPVSEVPTKLTGMNLYMRQFAILIKRQVKYIVYNKWSFLILQFLLPVMLIANLTNTTNNKKESSESTSLSMDLDMYGGREGSRVKFHVDGPDVKRQDVDTVRRRFPKVTFEDINETAAVFSTSDNIYEHYLAGVELNHTDAKVTYTTVVRHAAPVALNLLSNMLASHYIPGSDGQTITTINEPMDSGMELTTQSAKGLINGNLWGLCIEIMILFMNITNISLPCKERETGTRHIHVMSGCPASLHWLSTLLFHTLLCIVTSLVPVIVLALVLDKDSTINQANFLVAFTTIMLLGSMAVMACGYLVSYFFSAKTTAFILTVWVFLFGMITPFMQLAEKTFNPEKSLKWYILYTMKYICVPHTVTIAVISCILAAITNANCKLFRKFCPRPIFPDVTTSKLCCAGENPGCYFCIKMDESGECIIIILVQLLIFMTLVILVERGIFLGIWHKLRNMNYVPDPRPEQTASVRAEEKYVQKAINLPEKKIPDAFLANDLHKVYNRCCKRTVKANQGVSFSVKKGECVGLLGVNGAGKSTVFKMITVVESATSGNIFANGHHLRRGNSQYLKTLGYCPQFFGLDRFLTGEENLEMILTLRGYDTKYVKDEIKNWIDIVGLQKHARKIVESYSGGCQRRMGAAAALCGDADLLLLDEPSAGVDPAARRRLWSALRRALRRKRSMLITSHSMDEMEALCHRIAIMASGRIRALGTPSGLRKEHAQGYAVMFKLSHAALEGGANAAETLKAFKSKLQTTFKCALRDEHVTMLNYHIFETMRLSDLFIALEALREEFPSLIEDYSVSETTLEEVFLYIAKENQKRNSRSGV